MNRYVVRDKATGRYMPPRLGEEWVKHPRDALLFYERPVGLYDFQEIRKVWYFAIDIGRVKR